MKTLLFYTLSNLHALRKVTYQERNAAVNSFPSDDDDIGKQWLLLALEAEFTIKTFKLAMIRLAYELDSDIRGADLTVQWQNGDTRIGRGINSSSEAKESDNSRGEHYSQGENQLGINRC